MRVPVPKNRLVALTLVGAVLTAAVAVGLALPGLGPAESPDRSTPAGGSRDAVAADAPTPNPNFTPAVDQRAPSYEEEREEYEHEDGGEEEYEEHDDDEDEEHDDGEDEDE